MLTPEELGAWATKEFSQRFVGEPEVVSFAPGRANLIGEHTDYHEGFAFPFAIDRGVAVAARRSDASSHIYSSEFGDSGVVNLSSLQSAPKWAKYCLGAISLIDAPETNIQAVVVNDLPSGAGVSSSAAIETAFLLAALAIRSENWAPVEVATLCQKAENNVVGAPCGLMDQLAVSCGRQGHALFMDLRLPVCFQEVPFPDELSVIICDSGVKHDLGDSGYPLRRQQSFEAAKHLGVRVLRDIATPALHEFRKTLDPLLFRRALHITSENDRCHSFQTALNNRDFAALGRLINESHQSLRDLYEVSSPEQDQIVEICWGFGDILGARMMGGGFGGSVLAVVSTERAAMIVDHLREQIVSYLPNSRVFQAVPSTGACVLSRAAT